MLIVVACETCQLEIERHETTSTDVACTFVLAAHATTQHAQHKVVLSVSGQETEGHPHTLSISCRQCKTDAHSHYLVPRELVGVMALEHHSRHEGHPFDVTYDGKAYARAVMNG